VANAGELQGAVFAPLRWASRNRKPKPTRCPAPTPPGHRLTGRDVLARLLWGARLVLQIGLVSELIALVIGSIYGAFMGYFVGKVDSWACASWKLSKPCRSCFS